MYFKKVPSFFSIIYPKAIWNLSEPQKIYLTFDDGPNPDSTPALLNALDQLNIKANFFCLGHRAEKYPELITEITQRGHCLGHHGYRHLSGWTTAYDAYIQNVEKSSTVIDSIFYRPPYGRMTYRQYRTLSKKYKVIMWDNMPGDFDPQLTDHQVLKNLEANTSPGSVIVMHDTLQSWSKNQNILNAFKSHIDTLKLDFGLLSDTILTEEKLMDRSH